MIMWMTTTKRPEVGSEYVLFIFLKGMEIAFRKPNGFFCLPYQLVVRFGGDASPNLTLLQEEGNLRFPGVDGKSRSVSPDGAVRPLET